MSQLYGVDARGDPFVAWFPPLEYDDRGGIVEAWVIVQRTAWLQGQYPAVPLPVFTEWWE